MRLRTMIGSVAILIFLAVWVRTAMVVADHLPPNQLIRFIYFVVAGVGWSLPVLPLMSWMAKDR
jgi:hypothetical protein